MQKITYLLGAGASAQCLPVVNEMSNAITATNQRFILNFGQPFHLDTSKDLRYAGKLTKISKDLEWLKEICDTHYSVDTYAKKLDLKGSEKELFKLKSILSIYFTLQQKLTQPDKRYDNFWASILNEKDKFPKNMRIISWNYDSQLELSYRNFVSSSISLEEAYSRINMSSFHDIHLVNYEDFAIFKLNGSAKKVKKIGGEKHLNYLVNNLNFNEKSDFIEELFDSYTLLQQDEMKTKDESMFTELSFAWEHNLSFGYYENLKASIIDTKVLVVIGYSFPFFNRKIDKLIINEGMPMLEKVYFQAPDAENLKERFLAINSRVLEENMFLRKDKNQFTFPNELDI